MLWFAAWLTVTVQRIELGFHSIELVHSAMIKQMCYVLAPLSCPRTARTWTEILNLKEYFTKMLHRVEVTPPPSLFQAVNAFLGRACRLNSKAPHAGLYQWSDSRVELLW